MKKILLLLVGGIMLTSCSKKGWNENDKKEYVEGCQESALSKFKERNMEVDTLMLKNLCNCSLEKIISQGLTKDNPSKEKAMQIMQECAKELAEKQQN